MLVLSGYLFLNLLIVDSFGAERKEVRWRRVSPHYFDPLGASSIPSRRSYMPVSRNTSGWQPWLPIRHRPLRRPLLFSFAFGEDKG
jgi:hypothetical protein